MGTPAEVGDDALTFSNEMLALVRTKMAGDRTALAYLRSTVTLVASGLGLLKFAETPWINALGWPVIVVGFIVGIVGLREYLFSRRVFEAVKPPQFEDIEKKFR